MSLIFCRSSIIFWYFIMDINYQITPFLLGSLLWEYIIRLSFLSISFHNKNTKLNTLKHPLTTEIIFFFWYLYSLFPLYLYINHCDIVLRIATYYVLIGLERKQVTSSLTIILQQNLRRRSVSSNGRFNFPFLNVKMDHRTFRYI